MKGYTVALLAVLTALPNVAGAAVSRIIPGDTSNKNENTTVVAARNAPNTESEKHANVASRETKGRNNTSATTDGRTAKTPSRVVSTTTEQTRKAANNSTRVSNRLVAATRAQSGGDSAREKLNQAVNTVGRSSRTDAASINNNPAVRRQGLVLRPSTAEVGGRAIIASSGKQTGSNIDKEIRNVSSRAATKTAPLDAEAISRAKEAMEQTVALNKSCQEQYNDCMDQFCSVIDANQKRCACSSNLARYSKAENAVKEANVQLNDVAQNIRYVGLSADEIRAIMNATEAEEALSKNRDKTESRKMLSQIEKMILDPTSSSSSSSDSFGTLDLDFDFSADDGDMFDLSFLGGQDKGFSSLRGSDLYKAAKKRCAMVLNQCKEVGATADQITGNYDVAIDKDCIAYEQGLIKMNDTLLANVRSANRMLQKARLTVLQNYNAYDARGCVNALETCMTDEMVCGADYRKCLDPTKIYMDENGSVVLGQNISDIKKFMQNFNNAAINKTSLGDAYQVVVTPDYCRVGDGSDGRCVQKYLLDKIGTKQKATDEGLCRPVLDKCRAYTYDSNGNYMAYNDIVVNYIQRAMTNIKSSQEQIIHDYASTCLEGVSECYNQQVSQINSWAGAAQADSIRNVMSGACRNVSLTCAYAVFYGNPTVMNDCGNDNQCLINNLSTMFYQTLLCPDNSTYNTEEHSPAVDPDNTEGGWVNEICKCNFGFSSYQGTCMVVCPANSVRATFDYTVLHLDEDATYDDFLARYEEFLIENDEREAGWVSGQCRCKSGYKAHVSGSTEPGTCVLISE